VVLASKQRALLAILLLQANRIVPAEALIDALWDDAPPASARTTLQGYVKQLRQHADIQAGKRLVTRSPGYLIMVEAGELHLYRFTGLCDRARLAAGHGERPCGPRLRRPTARPGARARVDQAGLEPATLNDELTSHQLQQ
jgi:DNA-binding SARP family transcriptional activator